MLTLLTLLVIPTGDSIRLNKYLLGIRTDHWIHATLFLPFMGFFWVNNFHRGRIAFFFRFFILGILFCALCESLHYFIPYRSFSLRDFYANLCGLTIGSLIFLFRSPLKKRF